MYSLLKMKRCIVSVKFSLNLTKQVETFFGNIKMQNYLLIFERKLLIVCHIFEITFSQIEHFLPSLLKTPVK